MTAVRRVEEMPGQHVLVAGVEGEDGAAHLRVVAVLAVDLVQLGRGVAAPGKVTVEPDTPPHFSQHVKIMFETKFLT